MKKLLRTIITVVICYGLSMHLVNGQHIVYETPAFFSLKHEPVTIKLNEVFDPQTLVYDGDYDRIEYPIINSDHVGYQLVTFIAHKGLSHIIRVKEIQIIDTIAPVFTKTKDLIKVKYQQEVDLKQYFEASDNYDPSVSIVIEGSYDFNESGSYSLEAIAKDRSFNTTRHNFILEVAPKPQPKPKPVTKTKVTTTTSSATLTQEQRQQGYHPRMTRYGMDCVGCIVRNGIAYTSTGIGLTPHSVRQKDGSWQEGITYNGRYLFGSSKNVARCTLFTLYDHPFEGMGIKQGEPILGFIGDYGAVADNHLDLFVGSEHNLDVVKRVHRGENALVIITGVGEYNGRGCDF